ncbi:hypothetical protein SAMN05421856_105124 [Chryseobacterium taichungense]|uniref:Uncharacterized protein n=1 Tax=Chryseobacterium taichungense TaxID=295069 RepID=A0A1H8A5Z4_9FLAO|nr:hypothetical protein SAMN05421856_105124 [Chryseobacterium taichungense]
MKYDLVRAQVGPLFKSSTYRNGGAFLFIKADFPIIYLASLMLPDFILE